MLLLVVVCIKGLLIGYVRYVGMKRVRASVVVVVARALVVVVINALAPLGGFIAPRGRVRHLSFGGAVASPSSSASRRERLASLGATVGR